MQLYNSEKKIQIFRLVHCSNLQKMYLKSESRGNNENWKLNNNYCVSVILSICLHFSSSKWNKMEWSGFLNRQKQWISLLFVPEKNKHIIFIACICSRCHGINIWFESVRKLDIIHYTCILYKRFFSQGKNSKEKILFLRQYSYLLCWR